MGRRGLFVLLGLFGLALLPGWSGYGAKADPAFRKEFEVRYVKKDSTDPMDQAFAEKVKKIKCNVCHVGKNRKNRNAYGIELSKLLDRKKDRRNKAKIQQALETVGAMKVNADEENSPTFNELFAQGELPKSEESSGK